MKEVSSSLSFIRTSSNLSLKETAGMVHVSTSSFHNFEKGIQKPSMDILASFADLFNLLPEDIMGENTCLMTVNNSLRNIPADTKLYVRISKDPFEPGCGCQFRLKFAGISSNNKSDSRLISISVLSEQEL